MTAGAGLGTPDGMSAPHASAPFHELLGFILEEWREDYVRIAIEAGDRHLNRSNIVHGGAILSLIDQAGGMSGLWCDTPGHSRKGMTVDLNCHFTGQTLPGRVYAEGRMVSRGGKIYFARTEVFDSQGRMVAFGSSTHRWRSGSETLAGSPDPSMAG